MRKGEIVFSLLLAVLSIATCVMAFSYEYYLPNGPGPGFFPVWVTGIMAVSSITNIIKEWKNKKAVEPLYENKVKMKRVYYFLSSIILYILFINIVGMIAASYVFLFIMYWLFDKKPILKSFLISTGIMVFFYVTFVVFFDIPMPKGLFGII